MAVEPQSGDKAPDESGPRVGGFQDRTFMGGIAVATRSSLFVMLALTILAAGGFGLFYADRELGRADARISAAAALSAFAAAIERDVWRIRAKHGELSEMLTPGKAPTTDMDIAATREHIALAEALGGKLDELYSRPDAARISEQISTVREAVAQYVEEYRKAQQDKARPVPDLNALEAGVRQSVRNITKTLTTVASLGINDTMAAVRAATTEFIESGARRDLNVIEAGQKELDRLLTSIPISDEAKNDLRLGLADFQAALNKYAGARLFSDDAGDRLDEIVSYMTPSVEAINTYARDNFIEAETDGRSLRRKYRTLVAAAAAGSVLLLALFGLALLRSISRPLSSAARAARKLAAGDTDIAVSGLANEDETGDIARAFWNLKGKLAAANAAGDSLEQARAEAERGRAASAETEWLRRDLEAMKAQVDKGKDAIAEVAMLRKIIDATADNIDRGNAAEGGKTAAAAPVPAPETPTLEPLDTISSISRRVAQSSENVTAAAAEAERTGTLIRNLSDAAKKISGIEALIASIGEQADMLVVNAPQPNAETSLVIMSNDTATGEAGSPAGVGRRFDAIRSAAGQATWAVRDIAALITECKGMALDIARLSSAEALEVTTDLLQQSENLRSMLDTLVDKMQQQITDGPEQNVGGGPGPA